MLPLVLESWSTLLMLPLVHESYLVDAILVLENYLVNDALGAGELPC